MFPAFFNDVYWDDSVLWQSHRQDAYRAALARLLADDKSYYCTCTRRRIRHLGGFYDGHCRTLHHGPDNAAMRLKQTHPVLGFTDELRGDIRVNAVLAKEDFIIHRRDGLFAYNLAVVVDDND